MPSKRHAGISASPTHLTEKLIRKALPNASPGYIAYALGQQAPVDGASCPPKTRPAPVAPRVPPKHTERVEGRALLGGGEGEASRPGRFEVDFVFFSQRPADADGYCVKQLLDAVVRTGLIPDDAFDAVVWQRSGSRKVQEAENEGTLIEIYAQENPDATAPKAPDNAKNP